ncbi:MAG: OmpH family outer membrane protein [bacterium]
MRAALIPTILLAVVAATSPALAQDKIAYANIQAIISLMPETKTAAQGVDSLGRQLAKELDVKQAYEKQKLEEAQKAAQKGATDADLDRYRKDLKALDDEIRQKSEDADSAMARRKADLMEPVLQKLEATIREVAKADGYTYVLNSIDGQGNSIVLYGQDDRDITKKILTKLGIPIPKGAESKGAESKGAPGVGAPSAGMPGAGVPGAGTPKAPAKGGAPKAGGAKPDSAKTPAPAPTSPKAGQSK